MANTNNSSEIHDTAFWMAGCRADLVGLSKDVYAKHWLNEASRRKHIEYVTKVSPTENITLSLRNRFFLEEITNYLSSNPGAVFINIGAGFSSYPFLMPESVRYCEVDCAQNVEKKKRKIKGLQESGILPKRNIKFYQADLDNPKSIKDLSRSIKAWVGNSKSFLLYEGLIYYLKPDSINQLFKMAADIQTPKSRLGVVSWNPQAAEYPVYKRFVEFFTENESKSPPSCTCHDPEMFNHLAGYQLKTQTGYIQLSKRYEMQRVLTPEDDVFWETLSILERRNEAK